MLCKLQSTAYANFFLQQLLFLQWLGSAEMCRKNLLSLGYTGPEQGAVFVGLKWKILKESNSESGWSEIAGVSRWRCQAWVQRARKSNKRKCFKLKDYEE